VVVLLKDEALKTAEQLDKEAAKGQLKGPLHGVPMTIKEQFWLKNTPSTVNARMFKDWTAPEDAVIVNRLKKAGAIILGKTNVAKHLSDFQTYGDIYPPCKNPYNTDHTPGGSSGGAAAALASGMTPVELGGDIGGSIRIPSAYCGLYGLKPTEDTIPGHGNVPRHKKAKSHVLHMAQAGPMARTPDDLVLIWNIIKGPHDSDRKTPKIDWKTPTKKGLKDYTIAWTDSWPGFKPGDSTKKMIRNFVDKLSRHQCHTINISPGDNLHTRSLSLYVRLFPQLISQDVPRIIRPLMKMVIKRTLLKGSRKFHQEFNRGFKNNLLYYSETMGIRAGITREWEQFFNAHDFLICPVGYGPAIKRCKTGAPIPVEDGTLPYIEYSWPYTGCFNASGHPALTIPLGLDASGMPVGVQIAGPYWSEPELLNFATLAAELTPGFIRPDGY
jgi:amidase